MFPGSSQKEFTQYILDNNISNSSGIHPLNI